MPFRYTVNSEYFFPLLADNLFCDLTPQSLAFFDKIKQTKRFSKGACVFSRGDAACRFYILRRGKARLFLTNDLKKTPDFQMIKPNEVFGLTETIAGLPYETNAAAITNCTCECIDGDDFIRFLQAEPELCFRLVRMLGSNLQKTRQLFFSSIN